MPLLDLIAIANFYENLYDLNVSITSSWAEQKFIVVKIGEKDYDIEERKKEITVYVDIGREDS